MAMPELGFHQHAREPLAIDEDRSSLQSLLDDPMVRLLMQRDGIRETDVRAIFTRMRRSRGKKTEPCELALSQPTIGVQK